MRYTECHTAVLRVETLDARWNSHFDYGARPYVELQLGDRVVAPHRLVAPDDENEWMREDFSMLLTQPYCADQLQLRVKTGSFGVGVTTDAQVGCVSIPLVLEPPGRHASPAADDDPTIRELRLASKPGPHEGASIVLQLSSV